jgi:hypothetical protein
MKTAMQQLIEFIDKQKNIKSVPVQKIIKQRALYFLEVEKQQIGAALDYGWEDCYRDRVTNTDQYFNETFGG